MRRVKLRSGESVEVHVDGFGIKVPCALEAPHTATVAPVACIDRGSNFHGSLREWFYVTSNTSSDCTVWVLWLGDSGSQNDDNVGRLLPVAYCSRDFGGEEWLEFEEAVPTLIGGYAAWIGEHYEDHYDQNTEVEGSDLVSGETLKRLFDLGG